MVMKSTINQIQIKPMSIEWFAKMTQVKVDNCILNLFEDVFETGLLYKQFTRSFLLISNSNSKCTTRGP